MNRSPQTPSSDAMEELSSLRQENHSLHGINADLRQQLAVAQCETAVVAQAAQELHVLQESISWKITRPLRWMRRRIKLLTGERQAVVVPPAPAILHEAIGVFVHIHYDDLALELANYIRRIPNPKRIYISTDTSAKAERIGLDFSAAGLGQGIDIRVFPNRGFDVGPFLVGFAEEIGHHDLIVRLHGKKSSHIGEEAGAAWRCMLLDSLLGDAQRIQAILSAFENHADLGMVCPQHWEGLYRLYDAPISIGSNLAAMASLLGRYNVPLSAATPIDFPSGSMFWCRNKALTPWLRFGFSWDSFEPSGDESRDASLAHALERSFLFGCGLEGLTWARADLLPASATIPK